MPISDVRLLDCMEGMKAFPDKFFDLAIVDPPYGIKMSGYNTTPKKIFGKLTAGKHSSNFVKKNWDNSPPDQDYFNELFRTSKEQIIWGGNYFTKFLFPSKGWIFWYKHTNGQFADGELAWTSFDIPLKCFDFVWNGLLQQDMKNKEERIHPTQKPVKLYKWTLHNYAKPGFKILDTHVGSGSNRIAAFKNGFDFWGFEIDEDHFRDQEKRFKEQTAQIQLFT